MNGNTLMLIAALVGGWWLWSKARRVTGRTAATGRWGAAVHEAGHAQAARRLGGRVTSGRLARDGRGGEVNVHFGGGDDRTYRINSAVFMLAGGAAGRRVSGRFGPSGHDKRQARRKLRGTGVSYGQAQRRAEHLVASDWGAVQRTATKLYRDGRL